MIGPFCVTLPKVAKAISVNVILALILSKKITDLDNSSSDVKYVK
jgi:hypothetical protein